MATKQERACGAKYKHRTRASAYGEAKGTRVPGMSVYQCAYCRHWHIGKSRKAKSATSASDRIGHLLERHKRRAAEDKKAKHV
jgi:hypothetical protein